MATRTILPCANHTQHICKQFIDLWYRLIHSTHTNQTCQLYQMHNTSEWYHAVNVHNKWCQCIWVPMERNPWRINTCAAIHSFVWYTTTPDNSPSATCNFLAESPETILFISLKNEAYKYQKRPTKKTHRQYEVLNSQGHSSSSAKSL